MTICTRHVPIQPPTSSILIVLLSLLQNELCSISLVGGAEGRAKAQFGDCMKTTPSASFSPIRRDGTPFDFCMSLYYV